MRVLLVTPYAETSATGVGAFVRSLSGALGALGVQTTVLEPSTHGPPGLANFALALHSARAAVRLRRSIDVVHCQQFHLQTLLVAITARILGKAFVVTVHGRSSTPRGIRGAVFHVVESLCLAVTPNLVFVAESLRSAFGVRGRVIPNGVDVPSVQASSSSRDEVRRDFGIENGFVLVFLGRATVDKGIPCLVEAWESVRRAHAVPVPLLIIGPVEDAVSRFVERDGLIVTGATRTPWRFLAAGDLFVLPSTREGLPLSMLEAMAAGIPVIATDVGDVGRVVEPGVTGLLVPVNNAEALADAVSWALAHPADLRLMAKRASELVAAKYSLAAMTEGYLSIYHTSLAQAGNAR